MNTPRNIAQLLPLERPGRANLWGPVITTINLVLLWAETGIGKTYFALKLAHTFAAGGQFLKWSCPVPHRVLYIDGEMGALEIRDRLLDIDEGSEQRLQCSNFDILSFEDFPGGRLPNLGSVQGQAWYSEHIKPYDVIFVDNLLSASFPETKYDSDFTITQRINQWAVTQRANGKTIIMIHHSGKSGDQLGSSTKRVHLDTEIKLEARKPSGDFTQFVLRFCKHRYFYGRDEEPMLVRFSVKNRKTEWAWEFFEDEV